MDDCLITILKKMMYFIAYVIRLSWKFLEYENVSWAIVRWSMLEVLIVKICFCLTFVEEIVLISSIFIFHVIWEWIE